MNSPDNFNETPEPRYLFSSEELLVPEVDAVEIGTLEKGKFPLVREEMFKAATLKGVNKPVMVADLIFQEKMRSELGSAGQPYPITEDEWELMASQVPQYCGNKIPKIYMVDANRFNIPI